MAQPPASPPGAAPAAMRNITVLTPITRLHDAALAARQQMQQARESIDTAAICVPEGSSDLLHVVNDLKTQHHELRQRLEMILRRVKTATITTAATHDVIQARAAVDELERALTEYMRDASATMA